MREVFNMRLEVGPKSKRIGFRIAGAAILIPIVFGIYILAADVAVKAWKIGWDWQSHTFLSVSSAIYFIVYTTVAVVFLGWFSWAMRDKVLRTFAIVSGVILVIFLLGLLTSKLGLLHYQ